LLSIFQLNGKKSCVVAHNENEARKPMQDFRHGGLREGDFGVMEEDMTFLRRIRHFMPKKSIYKRQSHENHPGSGAVKKFIRRMESRLFTPVRQGIFTGTQTGNRHLNVQAYFILNIENSFVRTWIDQRCYSTKHSEMQAGGARI